jgi:hypothetical protein
MCLNSQPFRREQVEGQMACAALFMFWVVDDGWILSPYEHKNFPQTKLETSLTAKEKGSAPRTTKTIEPTQGNSNSRPASFY